MKRILLSCFIGVALVAFTAQLRAAANPDIELLRKKFTAELLEPPVQEAPIRTLINTLQPDGTWPGIDYIDTARTAFQHTRHLANLVQMSRAYKKKGSPLAGNKELKKALSLSLDYWLQHNFICENWWNNEIGTPDNLTAVLLMMDNSLTKEQIEKTSAITGRAHINAWGARQSGDRIKIAGIQAKNALFMRDTETFEMLMKVIESEIRFVPFEQRGLMYDYSFHHRDDKVNNTLSYGLGYAESFVEWADKVAGTRYQFSAGSIKLLTDYYLDGICKMMVFGKYPDPGATNRDITRPRSGSAASATLPGRLLNISDYRKGELQEIVDIRRNNAKPTLSFGAFYWHSEHYTHQRPSYFASVRMFSTRNNNMEEPYNGEGLMNHHRGDGTNYLSLTGAEYFNLSPVYDWQKIPGTTVMQKPALPSETQIQKAGVMEYAGAVTDGTYGAVGFDFISPHDPLKARKSWFFFDSEYVCLGAGINSSGGLPVATTLEQCKLEGSVTAGGQALPQGEHPLDKAAWVFHANVGYIFPEPAKAVLSNGPQTGSWFRINRQTSSSKQELSMDVFKLWINHGARAANASYAYIVMPAATLEQVKAASANPNVEVLSNTPGLQAVWHKGLHILQAVFYKSGEITFGNGLKLAAGGPCILMCKLEGGNIREVSVSDPLRTHSKVYFSINRKLNLSGTARSYWNEAKGISETTVEMPQAPYAGKSLTLRNE
ncbi:chloramphenicol resistance protein [Bacteroidia bacterium]|nr:chloramphenicol resistance protein [Bacteroidia bacterium]